jgi:hypothetical protein
VSGKVFSLFGTNLFSMHFPVRLYSEFSRPYWLFSAETALVLFTNTHWWKACLCVWQWALSLYVAKYNFEQRWKKHIMLLWTLMETENEVKPRHSLYLLNNSLAGWRLPAHKLFTKLQIKWHKSVLLLPYRKANMANFSAFSFSLMNKSISNHVFLIKENFQHFHSKLY